MTTSTENEGGSPARPKGGIGGAMADGLTLVRLIIAPIVALAIWYDWPSIGFAVLASVLFGIGALTDLFDDMLGGSQRSAGRMFGFFDDIADAILIGAALLALLYVINKSGTLGWAFAVPALVYMARDVIVGMVKGFEFSKNGAPHSVLGDIKSALAMLGTSIMIAAPWLQTWLDRLRAGTDGETLMDVYNTPTPWVWQIGQGLLWIAAILAVVTMVQHFTRKTET